MNIEISPYCNDDTKHTDSASANLKSVYLTNDLNIQPTQDYFVIQFDELFVNIKIMNETPKTVSLIVDGQFMNTWNISFSNRNFNQNQSNFKYDISSNDELDLIDFTIYIDENFVLKQYINLIFLNFNIDKKPVISSLNIKNTPNSNIQSNFTLLNSYFLINYLSPDLSPDYPSHDFFNQINISNINAYFNTISQ